MSTEKLIVKLESDSKKLREDLEEIRAKLDGLKDPIDKNQNKFKSLATTAATATTAIVAGATAAVTAMSAVIISTAKASQEMANFATTAKTSVDNFKALSFAMEQYGVDSKGTADAMNDVSERLGEFATAGSGAFQDFADVMGLTKDEAQKLAGELQYLSGEEAVLKMVGSMEDANVSGANMSFVLKSLSNDLEYASAAFADGGKKLIELKDNFNNATTAMKLTSAEAEIMQSTAVSFSLATKTLSQSATQISAQLAPEFESFFNYVIEQVPNATQGIIDFLNSMKSPEAITNLGSIDEQIRTASVSISNLLVQKKDLEASRVDINAGSGGAQGAGIIEEINKKADEGLAKVNERIQKQYDLLGELAERRNELNEQQAEAAEAEAEALNESSKLSEEAAARKSKILADEKQSQIDAIADRFKSEEELLTEKYEKELELAAGQQELITALENEYIAARLTMREEQEEAEREAERDRYFENLEELNQEKFDAEIAAQQELLDKKLINEETYLKEVYKLGVKYGKLDQKTVDDMNNTKEESTWEYADSAMEAAGAIFANNKAVSATLAFINTAEGVTAALAKYDYVGAALIAATGAAQIANITSASVGSTGSVSSPSETTTTTESTSTTSQLEVNQSVAGGSNTSNTLNFTADDADGIGGAIADWLNTKIKEGSVTLGG